MTMDWIGRFLDFAKRLTEERGPVAVVALILREEVAGVASTSDPGITERWDLLISASWLSGDAQKELRYLVELLRKTAGQTELLRISRVAIRHPDDPLVQRLVAQVQPGVEVTHIGSPGSLLGMMRVRSVIILTPLMPQAAAVRQRATN